MKNVLVFFFLMISTLGLSQSKTVKGKVSVEGMPLKGVDISVINKDYKAASAKDGSYIIKVDEGDVLKYSYAGLKTVDILVEDVTNILNVSMYPEITELNEVVVTKRVKKVKIETQRDYDENKTFLKTTFGMTDLSKNIGNVVFLQKDKFSPGARCILNLLQSGVLPGVNAYGDCIRGGGVRIRGFNSLIRDTPAVYDVDGVVFNEPPIWINPSRILRIAALRGIAASAIYGTYANGGVIVINTENTTFFEDSYLHPKYDTARLTDNVYSNDAVVSGSLQGNGSSYLGSLRGANTFDEAKAVYVENEKSIASSYFFALEAFEHFLNERKNVAFAKKVLEDNATMLQNDPVALKSLAYIYEAANYDSEAHELYKEIFVLRPQYAQSYFDLALSYRSLGNYQRATAMLMRYEHLLEQDFLRSNEHFSGIVDRELNNLLQLEGGKVVSDTEKKYVLEDGFKGTRLVFEWADSEAEFNLQFVNPENRYADWKHTINDNAQRIKEEKKVGYNLEEYLIDDALNGVWNINIKYYGNKKSTPTYLKTTIYRNYGSAQQSREVKVFNLNSKGINQNLFTIQNGTMMVSR